MVNNKVKVKKLGGKTDHDIPRFSFKSSAIIMLGAAVSTIVVPAILGVIGISHSAGVVVGNTFVLGFVLAFVRFFVETQVGFCKKFWYTYAGFGLAFGIISFFWMFLQSYV